MLARRCMECDTVNLGALPEDAQHTTVFVGRMDRMFTAVFVERMDRMFTAVFVEWMDRMFNVFNMLNTRLSLLGGWTECSMRSTVRRCPAGLRCTMA